MGLQESSKEIVRRYVAALNGGDWDGLRALFAPDAVIYGVLGWGGIERRSCRSGTSCTTACA